jgi:hypothetical protein
MNTSPESAENSGRRVSKALLVILASIAALLAIGLVMLPYGAKWYLGDWLRERGVVNVSIGDVDINPFTGAFAIQSLEYEDNGAMRRAGHVAVNLSWTDLRNRQIRLSVVELRDASLQIRRTESNRWLLGTIVLGAQETVEEIDRREAEAGWGFGIDSLQFADIDIDYQDPLIVRKFSVESASLSDFATWNPQQSTSLEISLTSADARLSASGKARPFAETFDLDLQLDGENLDAVGLEALLAQVGVESVTGLLHTSARVKVVAPPGDADMEINIDGELKLDDWRLSRPPDHFALGGLDWDGVVNITGADAGQAIGADGQLSLAAGEVELADAGLAVAIGTLGWRGQLAQIAGPESGRISGSGELNLSTVNLGLAEASTESGDTRAAVKTQLASLLLDTQEISLETGEQQLDAAWQGKLTLEQLHLESLASQAELASLIWDGALTSNGVGDRQLTGLHGALDAAGIAFADEDQQLAATLDSVTWQGRAEIAAADARLSSADGEIVASRLSARRGPTPGAKDHSGEPGQELLKVSELRAALADARADEMLSFGPIAVAELGLFPRKPAAPEEPDYAVSLASIGIDRLGLGTDTFSLGKVLLGDLQLWIERLRDGTLEFATQTGGASETDPEANARADQPGGETPGPSFSLAGLSLTGNSRLAYVDRSVNPAARLELAPLELELGAVDAAAPGDDTPITLQASLGRYGKLDFAGQLRPLAAQTYVNGAGKIKALDMILLDGFARRTIAYAIKSGTLSADVRVSLQDQQLDSLADLTIRKLDIDPLKPEEQDEFATELGVPLEIALGMLEDDQQTIRLDVPLKGDVADLSVGAGDAIRQVVNKGLMAGLKTAATTYFAPLWPALAVSKLFEVASALRFEPVIFPPGAAVVNAEQGAYLQEMAGLLAKRSKVSLALCGRAVAADLGVMYPELNGEPDADQLTALAELARSRNQAVKDRLIEAGIESDRLVTCKPEASPADQGPPRIDFGA